MGVLLYCLLKAAWDDVLRIDSGRRFHAAGPAYRRNFALRTWYAAAAERSRSIQPNVDLRICMWTTYGSGKLLQSSPEHDFCECFLFAKSILFICHRVCRRWERVAGDRYLWNQVDLTLFNTPLQQLTTFTKNYISYTLQSLQLKGYQTAGIYHSTACGFTNSVYLSVWYNDNVPIRFTIFAWAKRTAN